MQNNNPQTIYLKDYEAPEFLIDETFLYVDLFEDSTKVRSILKIRRNPSASEKDNYSLVLDGDEYLNTLSVSVDQRKLGDNEYIIEADKLTLIDLPSSFELSIEVEIRPQENTRLEGFYRSGAMFCSQCEAEGFRNITWYLDRPDVMSRFTTTISANKKYPVLLSNGNKVDSGESGQRHWATWHDPFPKPSYLFAMVVGDLDYIEDSYITCSGRTIKLQIFTESHNADKVDFAMSSLKNAMRWDEEAYGREYDLDIFMIVAVESFNMGAMENKGLNIFNTSCVLASAETTTDAAFQRVESVVGHEYFHNWSGNRVTCRDWFQLSLKEGLTVFRDQQFSESMGSSAATRINDVTVLRSVQFPEDASPTAHPVRPDSYIEINNFYTPTVYEKGAEVVRMISTLLGKEGFRRGTDLYFDRHDGDAVTTDDFVCAIEDANEIDLEQFRNWYSQAGTPLLDVTGRFDKEKNSFNLRVKQSLNSDKPGRKNRPYHIPLKVGLLDSKGRDIRFSSRDTDVANIDQSAGYSVVLNLVEKEQEFVFGNVKERPLPSLLRGFSAPVKLNYAYSRDDLTFLMNNDSDGFNRWEASNRLGTEVLEEMIVQVESGMEVKIDERLIKAFGYNLKLALGNKGEANFDRAMIANMLLLPSESYLIECSSVANVEAICLARKTLQKELAFRYKEYFLSVYEQNEILTSYSPDSNDVSRRMLRNLALHYLVCTEEEEYIDLCLLQFDSANNMTDVGASLKELVFSGSSYAIGAKNKALALFYDRWKSEPLVVDQWFAVQASCPLEGALDRVKALMSHEAFDIKIPNRVRSLVSQFSSANLLNFHKESGEGYEFLADRVIELNSINPQIAARTMIPLTRWKKFGDGRQKKMKDELNRILNIEKISPDVYEIATKSL